jgi:CRAL/TRIO domain
MCLIYFMERTIQAQDPRFYEFVMIIDCGGFVYNSIPPFKLMKEWADIMSKHFPKRLG